MNNAAAERAALRVLGSPHTWCSGQCLECPLSESCVSTRRSMQLSMLEESLSQPNGEAYFKKVWALLDRLCDQARLTASAAGLHYQGTQVLANDLKGLKTWKSRLEAFLARLV